MNPSTLRIAAASLLIIFLTACGGGSDLGTENSAPVADAGVTQKVLAGDVVMLNGSASSDADNDSLTYAWTLTSKPEGSNANLSPANFFNPTFTADLAGSYVASLIVHDGITSSSTASVSIFAVIENIAPIAHAGAAQNVDIGSEVTLDGSLSSDANGDTLTYDWTLVSIPDGSSALLCCSPLVNSTSPTSYFQESPAPNDFGKAIISKPKFTADMSGTYVARLIVTDGTLKSNSATVVITVAVDANAPTTPAGLVVAEKTSNSITLNWNASSGGAGGIYSYQIYRNGHAIGGMSYNPSTALSYTDANLIPGIARVYTVAAISVSGAKSLSSNFVEATTLSLDLLKAKLEPFIIFETATGRILGQAFASPGVIANAAPLQGYSVVKHPAVDAKIYGIKPIDTNRYVVYSYATGEITSPTLDELALNGSPNGNASYVTIDLNNGQIQTIGFGQSVTLLLNIASNADGGGGHLDKEIL